MPNKHRLILHNFSELAPVFNIMVGAEHRHHQAEELAKIPAPGPEKELYDNIVVLHKNDRRKWMNTEMKVVR